MAIGVCVFAISACTAAYIVVQTVAWLRRLGCREKDKLRCD